MLMFIFLCGALFELIGVLFIGKLKNHLTNFSALVSISLVMCITMLFLLEKQNVYSYIFTFVSIFRIFNLTRMIHPRLNYKELKSKIFSSSLYFNLLSLTLVLFQEVSINLSLDSQVLNYYSYTALFFAVLLFSSVLLAMYIYRNRHKVVSDKELPSVSVCIPARNETQDLPECMSSVLRSTYPKLEILVLDDCSHDKTPEVIKQYAHAGVRFIKGKEPSDDWLPKNAAYDRLADEANGDVLIFMGVDVRMKPNTITEIVNQLGDDTMISVLPKRSKNHESSFFIQPIRYWWELGLWRFSLISPPVLSTLWAVRTKEFKALGAFDGIRKAFKPEAHFAKIFGKKKSYSFLISNGDIGLTSVKAPKEQLDTAIRTRYNQLRRKPEKIMLTIASEFLIILLPYVILILSLIERNYAHIIFALCNILVLSIANAFVYKLVLKNWLTGFFTVPILVLIDWYLLIKSMYMYEFSEVIWKERNICIPMLQVEKSLPKLD